MSRERPNIYVLLDLEPSVDDWPTIEARIFEKKRQWSKDLVSGNPAARRRAAVAMDLLSTGVLEPVMRDPAARQVEAANARIESRAASAAKPVDGP